MSDHHCTQGHHCDKCHRATVAVYMALLSPFPRLQQLLLRIAFPPL